MLKLLSHQGNTNQNSAEAGYSGTHLEFQHLGGESTKMWSSRPALLYNHFQVNLGYMRDSLKEKLH